MKLKPLGDRVIVQALEEEETTASGIVLPDTAKEKPQKGKVLAVGDGRVNEETGKRTPLDVSEGDEVLYSKYGGTEIKVDGEDLALLGLLFGGVGKDDPTLGGLLLLERLDDQAIAERLELHVVQPPVVARIWHSHS